MATSLTPQNVVDLTHAAAWVVGVLVAGLSVVGAVAVWKTEINAAWAFFRMMERIQVLKMLTVMMVIASATVLALLGLIESSGAIGILSGVAGYVLGGLEKAVPPEGKDEKAERDEKPARENH